MRLVFFSFFLLAQLWSFSQTIADNKTFTVSELGNWVTKKISLDEVTKTLGTSSREIVTPEEILCEYKLGEDVVALQFDKDKKLTRIAFMNKVPVTVSKLSYENIKAIEKASNKQDVMNSFGQPNQLEAIGSEETWFYNITGKDGYKSLIIYFDLANADHIKYYSYDEEVDRETALTSSTPAGFQVGTSTISQVEALLGKPSKLSLESEGGERWYYHSKTSTLAVLFDKQSKLSNFSLQTNTN